MWLLVGGDSEIGAASHCYLADRGQPLRATTRRVALVSTERPLLDLAGSLDQWKPPAGIEAACIFAAVGRLAACSADPLGSAQINVVGTVAVAERLLEQGAYVLFLSTNQVFNGLQPHMAVDAPTSPVSEYGKQKARAEAALCAHIRRGAPVGILRLTKVLSARSTLLQEWAVALSQNKSVRAFRDMRLAPVPVDLVCEAIAALLRDRVSGIYQLSGPRDVSYAEAASHMAARIGVSTSLVEAVSAASARPPEGSTPPHTTLDSARLHQRYGSIAPDAFDLIETLYLTGEIQPANPQGVRDFAK